MKIFNYSNNKKVKNKIDLPLSYISMYFRNYNSHYILNKIICNLCHPEDQKNKKNKKINLHH